MTAWLLRLAGLLLMLTALAVSLSRAPDRPVQSLVARWAPPPSEFLDLDGQLVHYRDEGPRDDPLPIVLVHGTGSSLHTWEGWAQRLRTRRRVVSFDLQGFGLTGPNASGVYDTPSDARFALALLDRLGVQRFVIAGHSLGGEVAWRIAALAPQRVQQLILVAATGPSFESDSVPLAFTIARSRVAGFIGEHLLPREVVVASLRNVVGHPERVSTAQIDRYFELALREGNRRSLGQRLRQYEPGGPAAEARIAALRVPTLLLWGGRDRLVPPSVGETFARLVPGSRLVTFPELGHLPQEEDAAATAAPVMQFVGAEP